MKLPKKYGKYIGRYSECRSAYGRKCLRKCGFGPEFEGVKKVSEEVIAPKKKATRKKKSTK
tara:strand:+ start:51 stop:233 length:183 start_codon:yes stop_codon:yes gene_type:complete